MKLIAAIAVSLSLLSMLRADSSTNSTPHDWSRIYERMRVERGMTNALQFTNIIQDMVVHPSFGIWWHEIPPPTITNKTAMTSVEAFIASNGWSMAQGELSSLSFTKARPLTGLPWPPIESRKFLALTHNGVLYVMLSGWHHNLHGVAFNPATNTFPDRIQGFKFLGDHWYAWVHPEDWLPPDPSAKLYEGQQQK